MSNVLRTRDGLPYDFVDGLRIKGVDVTNWDKVFIDQGASFVGFTPVGNLSATNVQAAIAELENEKQSKTEPIATATNLRPGPNQGVIWDNDAFGGGLDTASITLESAGGEATRMRFKLTNDADDIFEFSAKATDGATFYNSAMKLNGHTLLNAANYVDFTAPMIADYATLRTNPGYATQVMITGNGLSGFFYRDDTDTTSADNGGTIIVSNNGKRWKRHYSGAVNVKWFGAIGDGITDDTAAVQKTVNFCLSFDPPAIMSVSALCRLDSSVIVNRPVDAPDASTYFIIKGDGVGAGFYAYVGVNMFSTTLTTGDPNVLAASQKVHFDSVVFKSEFPTNPTYVLDDAKFLRMKFTNCSFHRLRLTNATRYLQTYYFNNCMSYGWTGTFINGTNGAYDIKIDNFVAEAGDAFYSVLCNDVYSPDPNAQISITNSLFQSIYGAPVQADRTHGFVVENCYFEGNGANGAPDLKFDTARNLANNTPNGSIKVTGCFFSQRQANFDDLSYYPIRWGRVNNGFASANYVVDLGTGAAVKLHKLQPESRVVIAGDPGMYGQIYASESINSGGGYVQPGVGGERVRVLRGESNGAGAIVAGTGFTLTKLGAGQYQIDAQTPFSSPPTVCANPLDSTGQNVSAVVTIANNTTVFVAIRAVNHAFIDSAFTFIIIGPA